MKAEKHIYEIEKNLKQSRDVAEKMTKKLENVKKNLDFHQFIMTKKVEEDKKIEVIRTSQKQILQEQSRSEREESVLKYELKQMQRELKSIGSVHDEMLLNRNTKNTMNSIQYLNHQQTRNNELLEKSNKELEGLAR